MAVAVALLVFVPACSPDDDGDQSAGPATEPTSSPTSVAERRDALAPLPLARTEVAGTMWQGLVAVVGGITADGAASNQVDLFDPASDRWRSGPPLPLLLHHAGAAALGDRLYVIGGYSSRRALGQPVAQVWSLGPGEERWRQEPSLSAPRAALAVVAVGDRLVAVGGMPEGGLRRTEVLTPGAGGWRPGPDLLEAREHLALAASGGRVYAIGGRVGSLESNLRSVESWDPSGPGGWRPEPALNDSRGGTAAAEVGGRPCVAGGEEPAGTIASVECLAADRWEQVATLRTPRHGLAVVGVGDRLHVIGGGPTPGLSVSDAHEALPVG
ncbi:MAG TPA: kelch repeat-containing protein [Acidimicrobiales bacterium]|nr:kelch repeat-containing protein [Acidimicrobiales bacterium]